MAEISIVVNSVKNPDWLVLNTFSAIVSCRISPTTGGKTSESAVILSIKGERDVYTIQWAKRAVPSNTPLAIDSKRWVERFSKLAP